MARITFAQTLRTQEVEDPINLWLHRPLAYAFVRLVLPLPVSANAVTFASIGIGVLAAGLILYGTPHAMIAAGVLLWVSAILDGADGQLARARQQVSRFGRAIDGAADMIVVGTSVVAAAVHLYFQTGSVLWLLGAAAAIGSGLVHFFVYDFYKMWFLRMTQPDRTDFETIESVDRDLARLKAEGGQHYTRFALASLRNYLVWQDLFARFTNPRARRENRASLPRTTPEIAAAYRRENRLWIKAWSFLSPSPHADFFCLCAAFDRFDLYVIFRLGLMNLLMLVCVLGQRGATERALDEIDRLAGRDAAAPGAEAPQPA